MSPASSEPAPTKTRLLVAAVKRAPLAVPNTTAAVASALSSPSHCVPDGLVLLSMSNPHHRQLRELQFQLVRGLKCLMTRVVSICWGGWDDGLGTCVAGDCSSSKAKDSACNPSDYRRGQYVSLNWAKWPFFIDALRVARAILWIEADVVIVRNPFEALRTAWGTSSGGSEWWAGVDVAYQWETPPCNVSAAVDERTPPGLGKVTCINTPSPHPEPLNCGQLFIASSAFARAVWESRPAAFSNGARSQQHYANVVKHRYSHRGLPLEFYNHCWAVKRGLQRFTRINSHCGLVTYHATCAQSANGKVDSMRRELHTLSKCAT